MRMENSEKFTIRENFLLNLLQKLTKEYKTLLEYVRGVRPFKIVEILNYSRIPGETQFLVQVANKDLILKLTAGEIISKGYDLKKFSDFHADMVREAARGKLIEFLKLSDLKKPIYKITSKRLDRTINQYVFTIETPDALVFSSTAEELSQNKEVLMNMDINDIYDIGYTNGNESILKEKIAILMAQQNL